MQKWWLVEFVRVSLPSKPECNMVTATMQCYCFAVPFFLGAHVILPSTFGAIPCVQPENNSPVPSRICMSRSGSWPASLLHFRKARRASVVRRSFSFLSGRRPCSSFKTCSQWLWCLFAMCLKRSAVRTFEKCRRSSPDTRMPFSSSMTSSASPPSVLPRRLL